VDFFTDKGFFLLAQAFYGASMIYLIFLWRKNFRKDDHVTYSLLLGGFAAQTISMYLRGVRLDRCPIANLYEATTFVMWALVGACLLLGISSRLRFLSAFASPLLFGIGVFALMPGLDLKETASRPEVPGAVVSLHAAFLALAYGAFGLGSVAAIMFLTQERNLKFHKLNAILSHMPPIQRLDRAVGGLLIGGFILLTLGLLVGFVGLRHLTNAALYRGDPKIVWSLIVWVAYFTLLIMRWKFAQGGRRFAFGAIGTFAFVLLTFWGSNLLSPLHHP
jgi:HemX protein